MVSWLTRVGFVAVALAVAACAGGAGSPATSPGATEASPASASEAIAAPPDGSATQRGAETQPGAAASDDSAPSSDAAVGTDADDSGGPSTEEVSDSATEVGESSTATASAPEPAPRPSEILTAAGVIYILDYQASDVSKAASEKCDRDAGEDMEKRSECLKKERDRFRADALRFKSGAKGKLSWYVYRRDGDAFKEIHLTRFEFADESAREITLIPKGGAMGARPLFRGRRKVVLGVPSTYSLIIQDPQHGRLVYKARFESGGK